MPLRMHPPIEPGATPPATPPRAGLAKLVAWLIGVALVGCVQWVVFALVAIYQGAHSACGSDFAGTLPYQGGGQASIGSLVVAAVLGGWFWAAGGGVAFARRRHLGLICASFVRCTSSDWSCSGTCRH
jgi:hypothetical protein